MRGTYARDAGAVDRDFDGGLDPCRRSVLEKRKGQKETEEKAERKRRKGLKEEEAAAHMGQWALCARPPCDRSFDRCLNAV